MVSTETQQLLHNFFLSNRQIEQLSTDNMSDVKSLNDTST